LDGTSFQVISGVSRFHCNVQTTGDSSIYDLPAAGVISAGFINDIIIPCDSLPSDLTIGTAEYIVSDMLRQDAAADDSKYATENISSLHGNHSCDDGILSDQNAALSLVVASLDGSDAVTDVLAVVDKQKQATAETKLLNCIENDLQASNLCRTVQADGKNSDLCQCDVANVQLSVSDYDSATMLVTGIAAVDALQPVVDNSMPSNSLSLSQQITSYSVIDPAHIEQPADQVLGGNFGSSNKDVDDCRIFPCLPSNSSTHCNIVTSDVIKTDMFQLNGTAVNIPSPPVHSPQSMLTLSDPHSRQAPASDDVHDIDIVPMVPEDFTLPAKTPVITRHLDASLMDAGSWHIDRLAVLCDTRGQHIAVDYLDNSESDASSVALGVDSSDSDSEIEWLDTTSRQRCISISSDCSSVTNVDLSHHNDKPVDLTDSDGLELLSSDEELTVTSVDPDEFLSVQQRVADEGKLHPSHVLVIADGEIPAYTADGDQVAQSCVSKNPADGTMDQQREIIDEQHTVDVTVPVYSVSSCKILPPIIDTQVLPEMVENDPLNACHSVDRSSSLMIYDAKQLGDEPTASASEGLEEEVEAMEDDASLPSQMTLITRENTSTSDVMTGQVPEGLSLMDFSLCHKASPEREDSGCCLPTADLASVQDTLLSASTST
jgi:hypothetical protein